MSTSIPKDGLTVELEDYKVRLHLWDYEPESTFLVQYLGGPASDFNVIHISVRRGGPIGWVVAWLFPRGSGLWNLNPKARRLPNVMCYFANRMSAWSFVIEGSVPCREYFLKAVSGILDNGF